MYAMHRLQVDSRRRLGIINPYLRVDLLGMFQDADDISHHLNAHVIENILKDVET